MSDEFAAVLIGFFVFAALAMVITFTAVFTHEGNLRHMRYNKDEIIACINHGHSPMECRDMVYGRGQ